MPRKEIPEELILLLHAISEDKRLCEWLLSLDKLPLPVRQGELSRMAARIRSAAEDVRVADALSALAQARLYDAASRTIRELYFSN